MYSIFQIVHLLALFLLVAITAQAFAAKSPDLGKKQLMWSGIFSLIVFISGFGLLGIMKMGVPMWAIVKVLCWLILGSAVALAYRLPEKRKQVSYAIVGGLFLAIVMVAYKPF